MKILINTMLTVSLLGLNANAFSQELQDKRLKNVKRDLKIMTTIVKAAIGDDKKHDNTVEGTYLAGQGMLFTIGNNRGFRFHFSNSHDHDVPVAPTPPVAPVIPGNAPFSESEIEIIEESTMQAVEVAMEMAEMQMEFYSDFDWSEHSSRERSESRTQQRELQNQRRELERESRKLEREVREMERKLRDAEYQQELNASAENKSKIDKLEKELKDMTASMSVVAKKINEKAEALKAKANELRQKQLDQLNAEVKSTEKAISQAVCDFGSGLRSLSKGEFITFSLKGRSNRLYVFDLPSINKCADGDITADELLAKAVQYTL